MFETMAAFVLQEHLAQQSFDPPVGPPGDLRLLSPHNKPVRTKDGWISFTINTNPQVQAFLKATGRDALLSDERFSTVASRARYVTEWFEVRGAPLTEKTTSEWLELLKAADIAAQPCHTLETLQEDPHLRAVNLIKMEQHPTEGTTAAIRSTIRFGADYPSSRTPSQPRGWNTRSVLSDVGFGEIEIDELLAEGSAQEFTNSRD